MEDRLPTTPLGAHYIGKFPFPHAPGDGLPQGIRVEQPGIKRGGVEHLPDCPGAPSFPMGRRPVADQEVRADGFLQDAFLLEERHDDVHQRFPHAGMEPPQIHLLQLVVFVQNEHKTIGMPNQLPQLLFAAAFLIVKLSLLRFLQPQPVLLRRVRQAL